MAKTSHKPTLTEPFWPTSGGAGNRRLLQRPSPAALAVEWRVAFKDQITTPVVGGDGSIYVGGFDKHLYAFSPGGALVFKKKLIGPVLSDAAIGTTGLVFVAPHHRPPTGLETMLCAVDPTRPKNAEIVWSATFPGAARPLLPLADGGVVAVSSSGMLHGYDAAGAERFATRFGASSSTGATLLSDGTIVVIAEDPDGCRVIGVAPDGGQRFAAPVPRTLAAATALDDGGFWLISADSSRRRFDADGREVAVLAPLGAGLFQSTSLGVMADGSLRVAKSVRGAGALFDLDPAGVVRGQLDRGDGVGPPLGFLDGAALVAVQDGTVALITENREVAWSINVGAPASGASGTAPATVIPGPDRFVVRVDCPTPGNSDREPCELVGLV
jgi:outer membrane protein assembly factor BamB